MTRIDYNLPVASAPAGLAAGQSAQGDRMLPGEVLNPGQFITSQNGVYKLIYQTDGNLVVYNLNGNTALWSSRINGSPGTTVFQTDGNFVSYNSSGSPVWNSATAGNAVARLVMQNDGNAVIYRPDNTAAWSTRTAQQGPPPPVSTFVAFTYDAAGNRQTMTDPLGSVDYEYTSLSQTKSETRSFHDTLPNAPRAGNSFKLQYSYDLSGQLKSLTDPYGETVNYGYDKVGRLKQVTAGTPYGNNQVATYASDAKYRAWGAVKELDYGNNVEMTETFNDRLQPATFLLTGPGQPRQPIMQKNYSYYADGAPSYTQDVLNPTFDRLNTYDHAGRIQTGKTSDEARGGSITDFTQQQQRLPYRQSYEYNAFGNMTARANRTWGRDFWAGQSFNLDYTYQDNRVTKPYWSYDADGRVLTAAPPEQYASSSYDAAGRLITYQNEQSIYRYLDGDGREAKRQTARYNDASSQTVWSVTYYIRSSVLGGSVVSEASSIGRKQKTFITAAGTVLAWQTASIDSAGNQTGEVFWNHTDASGTSYRATMANGTPLYGEDYDGAPAEFDPLGNNVGLYNPYVEIVEPPQPPENPTLLPLYGDSPSYVNGQRVSCQLDGMVIGCSSLMMMMEAGALAVEFRVGTRTYQAPIQSFGAGIFRVDVPRWVSLGYSTNAGQSANVNQTFGDNDVIRVNTNLQNLGYMTSVPMFFNINLQSQDDWRKQVRTVPNTKDKFNFVEEVVRSRFTDFLNNISQDCINALSDLGLTVKNISDTFNKVSFVSVFGTNSQAEFENTLRNNGYKPDEFAQGGTYYLFTDKSDNHILLRRK